MTKKTFNILLLLVYIGIPLVSCRDSTYQISRRQIQTDPPASGEADQTPEPQTDPDNPPDVSGGSEEQPQPVGNTDFPLTMAFRAEETLGDGVLGGLENFDFIHTGSGSTVDAFLANPDFDDQKVIFHGSHAAVSTNYYSDVYAGHWLFAPGTTLTSSAATTATTLHVANSDVFETGDYCTISYRDSSGERQWDNVEEVQVTGIDSSHSKITVTRALYGTPATRWDIGTNTVVITPHIYMTPQTISENWAINVALGSPQNSAGQEGWEFFGEFVYKTFWQDKMAGAGDGIEFDSGRWVYDNTKFPVDSDNDGVADYGFKDGVNVYGLGASKYVAKVREQLPEGAILQIDSSQVEDGFRDPTNLNGIEMESFPDLERYDQFSSSLNHLWQWVEHTSLSEKLSYPFTKDDTALYQCDPAGAASDTDDVEINNYFRIGLASALIVGGPHPYAAETTFTDSKCFSAYEWDEYKGGNLNDWHWLGKPYGAANRSSSNLVSHDFLESATWSASDKNSSLPSTSDVYVYSAYTASSEKLILNLTRVPVTVVERSNNTIFPAVDGVSIQTDSTLDTGTHASYTVQFQAKSKNTYNDDPTYAEFSGIPRLVGVRITTATTNYQQNVLVWEDQQDFSLSFALSTPEAITSVSFLSGEESGTLTIENVKLFSGNHDRWVRYFEGGAVILNMTATDWAVTLNDSYSSNGFTRLTGTQDPTINSGASGSGSQNSTFTVPAFDALLVKIKE